MIYFSNLVIVVCNWIAYILNKRKSVTSYGKFSGS